MLGRGVATVIAGEEMEEGYQTVMFDAGGLASGVYVYQLEVEGLGEGRLRTVQTGKMILVK